MNQNQIVMDLITVDKTFVNVSIHKSIFCEEGTNNCDQNLYQLPSTISLKQSQDKMDVEESTLMEILISPKLLILFEVKLLQNIYQE